MQIDRILIVESPLHLKNMLLAKEELINQSNDNIFFKLNRFIDSVENYINGCKCIEEENYADMMSFYISIQTEEIISYLIQGFECDKIEFK
jgi:hypothetical protein